MAKTPAQKSIFFIFLEMGQSSLKGGSRAAYEPLNRLGGDAEDLRNLAVAQSFIMPEDHGSLLAGRKGIEREMDLVLPLFFDEAFSRAQ